MEITFQFERSTKNTHRYQEVVKGDAEPKIGTLYLKKSALAGNPNQIVVKITAK